MLVGLLAGAAIVLYVAFSLWYRELRVIYKCRSVSEAWGAGVLPLVRRSLNGHRGCVFHQASGLLVQITKTLAGGGNDAKINLHMVKVRVPNPGRFNMDAGRRYRRLPLRPRGSILRWHLPSVRKAARLSEVACGGSLERFKFGYGLCRW